MNNIIIERNKVRFTNSNFFASDRSTLLEEASRVGYINIMSLLIDQGYKKIGIKEQVLKTVVSNLQNRKEVMILLLDR